MMSSTYRLSALALALVLPLPNSAFALRAPESAESEKSKSGLEERLNRRDFLGRVGAGAGALAVAGTGLPAPEDAVAQELPAAGKTLLDLSNRLGTDRAVTAVVWGDPADLLEIPDFFENAVKVGIRSVFISSKFAELPRAKQQAILDRAKEARLPVLGLIFGNPDWVLESKRAGVRDRISQSLDALLELDWGKQMELVMVFDVEPHAREWRNVTGWNGDLAGYSSVLAEEIIPRVAEYQEKFKTRHGRPVIYERLPVISFEPHWWVNGHETEDGLTIKNIKHPSGIGIAGMTYQPTAQRILSVAGRVWGRTVPVERAQFLAGVETKPNIPNTFYGQEDKIPGVLSEVFDGLPAVAKNRFWGPFLHFGSAGEVPGTRRADQVIRAWAGKATASKTETAPAGKFSVVGGQTKEFVPERIQLQLAIPDSLKGKEKELVAAVLRKTDTFYIQKKDRETSAFRDIAADGSVTLESDRPLKGEKATARAVVVLKRADADAFKELYDEGRAQGAAKAAAKYGLAIIDIAEDGKARIVERLGQRGGLEERRVEAPLTSADAPGIGRLFIHADLPMIDRAGLEEVSLPASPESAVAFLREMGTTDADMIILPTTVAAGMEESYRPAGSAAPIVVMPASGLEEATVQELGALAWIARNLGGVFRVGLEEWADREISSLKDRMTISY